MGRCRIIKKTKIDSSLHHGMNYQSPNIIAQTHVLTTPIINLAVMLQISAGSILTCRRWEANNSSPSSTHRPINCSHIHTEYRITRGESSTACLPICYTANDCLSVGQRTSPPWLRTARREKLRRKQGEERGVLFTSYRLLTSSF